MQLITTSAQQLKKQRISKLGEDVACLYMEGKGCQILSRNWRTGHLELDVILKAPVGDDCEIIFVEVKTRSREFKDGLDLLWLADGKKAQNLKMAIRKYLRLFHLENTAFRADLIGVQVPQNFQAKTAVKLRHIKNFLHF